MEVKYVKSSPFSYLIRIHTATFLPFRAYNTDNQLIIHSNSVRKMEVYCTRLLSILNNESKALKAFQKCVGVIDNSGFDKSDKQTIKLVSKTKVLIDYAENIKSSLPH